MQFKYVLIFSLILLSCTFGTNGQKLDSLLHQLANHNTEDSVKLTLWMGIANEYSKVNPDKSIRAADSAIALAKQLNLFALLANAYNIKGSNLVNKGDNSVALTWFQKALSSAEQSGDKRKIWQTLNNIGVLHFRTGNFSDAISFFQRSLSIATEMNQKDGMAQTLSNISGVYKDLSDYPKALDYAQRALSVAEQAGVKKSMESGLNNIGGIYVALNDYYKADEYYKRALNIAEEINDKRGMVIYLNNRGDVFDGLLNYSKSLEYRLKALGISEEIGIKDLTMMTLGYIGNDYMHLSDFSKAFEYSERAVSMREQMGNTSTSGFPLINLGRLYSNAPDSFLIRKGFDSLTRYNKSLELLNAGLKIATETNSLEWQRNAWEDLSIVYQKLDDYPGALNAFENFIIFRDSVMNNGKKNQITRLEIQHEFSRKEDSLKLQQQLTDEKLKQQVLLAKQQEQQLELNKSELDLINKEKDVQRLGYLKTQADLQNEKLEKRGREEQLSLSEKEKQLQLAKVKTLTQEQTLNAFKQQQQWIYIIGGFILLGLIFFYIFYRVRLQQVRLKTEMTAERIEQQQKEMEFQRQLGDISLSALRSQMNPHFIFNCLNSIKLYTTQNDTAAASEYLTKFSRLIRLVLENSRNDRITLASELDALRLYMEMEAMRFKEKLKYSISVEKNVDLDYIEIPPLLLQPYVENAIWHGLMQKEDGGRIDINVSTQPGESMLVINITDNGIGRAKSAELLSKTATKHKSYGMKVTSERLALINRVYKTGANVTIDDLTDTGGHPSGTRVTIKILIES